MMKEEKLSVASQLAKNWYAEIIAIDMFGVLKFFVAQQLLTKQSYAPWNEIRGGKDISSLIENADFNNTYAMDRDEFAMRIANFPLQDFKFTTDYYLFTP